MLQYLYNKILHYIKPVKKEQSVDYELTGTEQNEWANQAVRMERGY